MISYQFQMNGNVYQSELAEALLNWFERRVSDRQVDSSILTLNLMSLQLKQTSSANFQVVLNIGVEYKHRCALQQTYKTEIVTLIS